MKHSLARLAALLIAIVASACNRDLLAPSASTLNGVWARVDEVPGSSERWNLVVDGTSISGTGTWSGEACCAGTLTLTGAIAHDSIQVDVTLVDAGSPAGPRVIREHFDGTLVSRTRLQ